jgi:hypothetical protein
LGDSQEVLDKIQASGEIWGRGYQGSTPSVNAWMGALPASQRGIEFATDAVLNKGLPPGLAMWTFGNPGVMLRTADGLDYGAIQVTILKMTPPG